MKISEETFQKTFNIFLVLLAVTVIFRKPCTWLILLFVVYNLFFYKKLSFSKISIQTGLIIASPFLLELLFFKLIHRLIDYLNPGGFVFLMYVGQLIKESEAIFLSVEVKEI